MKLLSTLTIAALLTGGAAFAASAPPPATPATTATPATAKHNSTSHCEKWAKEKKLAGEEAKKFVKDC